MNGPAVSEETPIGARVTAFVIHKRSIGLIGEATYVGYSFPPTQIWYCLPITQPAEPLLHSPQFGIPRLPTLQLDSGEYMWGCEVWWMVTDRAKTLLDNVAKGLQLPIVPLTLSELRSMKRDD